MTLDERREAIKEAARALGAQYNEFPHQHGVCGRLVSADGRVLEKTWSGRLGQGWAYDSFEMQTALWNLDRKRRTGGVNDAARVQCTRSRMHGFYPANERCPYCA